MTRSRFLSSAALAAVASLLVVSHSDAQVIESRALSDKIWQGQGVINLMRDIGGADLSKYFDQTGKMLLLGADINEDNSGNESSSSVGIAIKSAQLSLRTTDGDFTFRDFFTGTTAMLRESGSADAQSFHTMFGQSGSSQITGSGSLDISRFDDVMWFENINFTGDILGASLTLKFLDTPRSRPSPNSSEAFFDYSGGFEDFALFNVADSILVEEADIGMAAAPSDVQKTTTESVTTAIETSLAANPPGGTTTGTETGGTTGGDTGSSTPGSTVGGEVANPPAAPAPPFVIVGIMAALLLWKQRRLLVPNNA